MPYSYKCLRDVIFAVLRVNCYPRKIKSSKFFKAITMYFEHKG